MREPKHDSKAHGDNSIKKNAPETVCKTKCLRMPKGRVEDRKEKKLIQRNIRIMQSWESQEDL